MKKARLITASVAVAATIALSAFTFKGGNDGATDTTTTNTTVSPNATTWTLDRSHSSISFTVTHMLVSEVEGKFRKFEGTMTAEKADYSDAVIQFSADAASIDTDDEKRDGHLKSDDFFNADKYPKVSFKSTSFKKLAGNKYILKGDLTIRDVTKSVSWAVISNGEHKDPWGNTKAGFKANLTINRLDYGLKWNTLTETGGAVVDKDVKVTVNIEFSKK